MFPTMYTTNNGYVLKLFQTINPAMKKKRPKKMTGNRENRRSLSVWLITKGISIMATKKKQKKGTLKIKTTQSTSTFPTIRNHPWYELRYTRDKMGKQLS